MNREGHNGVDFFFGQEVEHTAMYLQNTLFVVGIQPVTKILQLAKDHDITHIYFGANHSYNPSQSSEYAEWENMILPCLKADLWCTLDFDHQHIESFLEGGLTEYRRFIPMVSVKLPYIDQLGYNAIIKLDDRDFDATNPGVWCHRLHDLKTWNSFTSWDEYTNDHPFEE